MKKIENGQHLILPDPTRGEEEFEFIVAERGTVADFEADDKPLTAKVMRSLGIAAYEIARRAEDDSDRPRRVFVRHYTNGTRRIIPGL